MAETSKGANKKPLGGKCHICSEWEGVCEGGVKLDGERCAGYGKAFGYNWDCPKKGIHQGRAMKRYKGNRDAAETAGAEYQAADDCLLWIPRL